METQAPTFQLWPRLPNLDSPESDIRLDQIIYSVAARWLNRLAFFAFLSSSTGLLLNCVLKVRESKSICGSIFNLIFCTPRSYSYAICLSLSQSPVCVGFLDTFGAPIMVKVSNISVHAIMHSQFPSNKFSVDITLLLFSWSGSSSLNRHKVRRHGHTLRAHRRRGYVGNEDLPFTSNPELEAGNTDNASPLPVPHIIANQATPNLVSIADLDSCLFRAPDPHFATPSVRNSPGPSSLNVSTHGPAFSARPVPYSANISDFPLPRLPGPSLPSLRDLALLDPPGPSNLGVSGPAVTSTSGSVPRHNTEFPRYIYTNQSSELVPLTVTINNVRLAPMLTPMNLEDSLSGLGNHFGQKHHENNQFSLAATTGASNLGSRNSLGVAKTSASVRLPTSQTGSLRPDYSGSQMDPFLDRILQ